MAFVVVMTMALVTALALIPCAIVLLIKSGGGARARRQREAATRARMGAIFGYDTIPVPAATTTTVRAMRSAVRRDGVLVASWM
ncbi:MAG TPA: hypothetical protein VM841_02515 [Actinomycetota bacterium]|nr:hypothetical protein [Actinomycetota bacterium]